MLSRMTSRKNVASVAVGDASADPGFFASTAYVRKSGSCSGLRSVPPLAWGDALMRRVPAGGNASSAAFGAPLASKSSSGR